MVDGESSKLKTGALIFVSALELVVSRMTQMGDSLT
jgi:hypothetical protein